MSKSTTFTVTGMKCDGCENAVSKKLFANKGVLAVTASRQKNLVEVDYDRKHTNPDTIKQLIIEAGYTVE